METTDNIIENFMFDFILRNKIIQEQIMQLSDFIYSQNIWDEDKKDIFWLVIWNKIIDSNDEIMEMISQYRKKKKIPKIYEILLSTIDEKVDIDDTVSLSCIQNEIKMDLEYIISQLSQKIVDFLSETIKKEILSKKSFFEFVSKDYVDEIEKKELVKSIGNVSYICDEEDEKNIQNLNDLIKNHNEKQNKILNIK